MTGPLAFRIVSGEEMQADIRPDDVELHAGEFLTARQVWLGTTALRQHQVVPGPQRTTGYDRLDNEILAGRRLYEVAEWADYPLELARLYGDEATSADPCALFRPYQGEPLSQVGTRLLEDEQEAFEASLLTGLCWLAAAGIAHRALSPDTVLWYGERRQVQITDFSRSTVFGVPREAVTGTPNWVAREQRPGLARGAVTERDDIWAAGRLIFFVRNEGNPLADRSQIAELGLGDLLDGVLGPPDSRPTARELLVGRLGHKDPVLRELDRHIDLREGRRHFWETRQRKYPGAPVPPEAAADLDAPPSQASPKTRPDPVPNMRPSPTAPDPAGAPVPGDQRKTSRWRRAGG